MFKLHFLPKRFLLLAFSVIAVLTSLALSQNAAAGASSAKGVFSVYDYGAAGDGKKLDTAAIQSAIDARAKAGGGKVCLHNGTFLSGTTYLKSSVSLYIEAGATLLGSKSLDDYTGDSIIYAEGAANIAVLGRGVIDGQGATFEVAKKRPFLIRFERCENVAVKDIALRDSSAWVQLYRACESVNIDGISVDSRVNRNNDGLNIDNCRKVCVSNCRISSGDDALVLKSIGGHGCENITVASCVLSTSCNALKMGTESSGGFKNITISNCAVYDTRLAGLALEIVDGGTLERVNVSNIVMENVGAAIFIRLGNRARSYEGEKPGMGSIKGIMINNIQAAAVGSTGCSITGLPNFPVENVTLSNIRIRFKGGGAREDALRQIAEKEKDYPEYSMFGTLPAYGFYCRHARGLRFQHLDLGFERDDHRPALVFEDVNDLDIFDFDARSTASAEALIWLRQVNGAFIHGCRPSHKLGTFLRVDSELSDNITLMNNDLSNAKRLFERGEGVKDLAIYVGANRTG